MPTGKWKHRDLSDRPWVRKPKNRKPTAQQLVFAKIYLETGDPEEAYNGAGYMDLYLTTSLTRRQQKHDRVLYSKGVQRALKTAREQVMEERRLGLDKIIEGLLLAHSHARNVREEVMALKEIATLLGFYDKAKVKEINKQIKGRELEELSQRELELLVKAEQMDNSDVECLCPLPEPKFSKTERLLYRQVLAQEKESQYQPLEMLESQTSNGCVSVAS